RINRLKWKPKYTIRGGFSMKIAVAIDGSDYAFRAAEHAVTLAKHFPTSEIIIIFVKDYSKEKDEYLTAHSVESKYLKREQKIQPIMELTNKYDIRTEKTHTC